MTSPFSPLVIIANPRAGQGRVAAQLHKVEDILRGAAGRRRGQGGTAGTVAAGHLTCQTGHRCLVAGGDARRSIARLSQPQHHLLGTGSGRIRRGSHGLVWLAGDSGFRRASSLVLTS